jgi:hypothetical protein
MKADVLNSCCPGTIPPWISFATLFLVLEWEVSVRHERARKRLGLTKPTAHIQGTGMQISLSSVLSTGGHMGKPPYGNTLLTLPDSIIMCMSHVLHSSVS